MSSRGRVGDASNVTATFMVLSYAGTLTITAVADPYHLPDHLLTASLPN